MTIIQQIQTLLGVEPDNIWGPKSQAALNAAKSEIVILSAPASSSFREFMPFLFQWEGTVYENDPDDPGGATKFGIDQRSHPNVNIRALTAETATAIYWKEWLEAGCDKMASPYAEVYFNCAVNMGIGRARQFNTTAQGNADKFIDLQEAKYHSIAANNRGLRKFLKGWLNRTNALRKRFNIY